MRRKNLLAAFLCLKGGIARKGKIMNIKKKSIKKFLAFIAIFTLMASMLMSSVPAFAADATSSVSDVVEESYKEVKEDILSIATNVVINAARLVLIVCVIVYLVKAGAAVRNHEQANWIPFIVCLVALIVAWVLPEALLKLV